jgi:hypothetical protein
VWEDLSGADPLWPSRPRERVKVAFAWPPQILLSIDVSYADESQRTKQKKSFILLLTPMHVGAMIGISLDRRSCGDTRKANDPQGTEADRTVYLFGGRRTVVARRSE